MAARINTKTALKEWDGVSVIDISEFIKEEGDIKLSNIPLSFRPNKLLKGHPLNLIAIDSNQLCITADGETTIKYMDALLETFQAKMIAEHVDRIYPAEGGVGDGQLRKTVLKSGKEVYVMLDKESFIILEATAKKSLPGPRTKTSFTLYYKDKLVMEGVQCETLDEAVDSSMLEMMTCSRLDDY
jgi:hypothetical protein